jgi:hypothetical protein
MKKLICLLAVLVALMGLTLVELFWGGKADAGFVEQTESVQSRTMTSTGTRTTSDSELRRVIRPQSRAE